MVHIVIAPKLLKLVSNAISVLVEEVKFTTIKVVISCKYALNTVYHKVSHEDYAKFVVFKWERKTKICNQMFNDFLIFLK